MASKRQQRRNELARELGYRNDYDRRRQEGLQKGYTLTIARGHPKEEEKSAAEQARLRRDIKRPGRQLAARDELVDWLDISTPEDFAEMLDTFGVSSHGAYSLWYGYETLEVA